MNSSQWVVALHGGAGSLLFPEAMADIDSAMEKGLDACFAAIGMGKKGLEVVVEGLAVLEACELFDCGYGSLIRSDGSAYLDISLVDGDGLFYAIAGLERIVHPSRLAHYLLKQSGESMFTSYGSVLRKLVNDLPTEIKSELGLRSSNEEMHSPFAIAFLEELKKRNITDKKGGTVGCVVRDPSGRIFVGTSTGGTPFAPVGRIGDTPIVGMGSFADNKIGGLSATGYGECFMSSASVAFAAAKMADTKSLDEQSLCRILDGQIKRLETRFPKVEAGLLAVSKCGCVASAHNTEIMPVAIGMGESSVEKKILCKNGVLAR